MSEKQDIRGDYSSIIVGLKFFDFLQFSIKKHAGISTAYHH